MTQGGFDEFWDGLDWDLADVDLGLSLEAEGFYSQPEWTVYRMSYNSTDGHRLFAWLSVPHDIAGENTPVLVRMPDYSSVHDIIYTPLRQSAIVMNPTYRGQRNSDALFQASYPGLLTAGLPTGGTPTEDTPTIGIDRHQDYIMRQVFGDALRAVDAVVGQSEFDLGRFVLTGSGLGGSLALAVAARRSVVEAVAADTPLALGHPALIEGNPPYPAAELVDYLRLYPDRSQAVASATEPLNPLLMAPMIRVPVLLSLGSRDRGQCPIAVGEELASLLPQCDLRVYDGASEGGGHEHVQVRGAWLRERLGLG